MSKMQDYLDAAVDRDASGLPASSTQISFGSMPFMVGENENLEEVTDIKTVCQCDAIVDIKIIDKIAMVSLDFSTDMDSFYDIIKEVEQYMAEKDHILKSINELMGQLSVAERNEDETAIEALTVQIRSLNIPFMLPTILPVEYDGEVQIGFGDDPKFIFFTSDRINEVPLKMTMIFDANAIFCQDDAQIYIEDTDAELQAMQEELWYEDAVKKMEEEAYQSQFGYNNDPYAEEDAVKDKRLKGVRFKK